MDGRVWLVYLDRGMMGLARDTALYRHGNYYVKAHGYMGRENRIARFCSCDWVLIFVSCNFAKSICRKIYGVTTSIGREYKCGHGAWIIKRNAAIF